MGILLAILLLVKEELCCSTGFLSHPQRSTGHGPVKGNIGGDENEQIRPYMLLTK